MAGQFIQDMFSYLLRVPDTGVLLFCLIENVFITVSVLVLGQILQKWLKADAKPYSYTFREWIICAATTVLNSIVTYGGFLLWKAGYISIDLSSSVLIAFVDFLILFFAMDLLMYLLHWGIHKTFLYKVIHQLHHQSIDPKPIDLFVLHPVEAICFGSLWLVLLLTHSFSFYAIAAYLTINVVFGLIGHLGLDPLPEKLRHKAVFRFLGTETFHHHHHQDVEHNFGFYTTIWDRLFRTLKKY
jgi:Delta7-sterol 5-desaturase